MALWSGTVAYNLTKIIKNSFTGNTSKKIVHPTAGLHNIRPAGHMRPARSFLGARENSVAENVAKARLRIITCPFRISSTLWRNRLLRPAASLCWSIWPLELSELCRPALGYTTVQSCWMLPRSPGFRCQMFCCNPSWHVGSWSHQHTD